LASSTSTSVVPAAASSRISLKTLSNPLADVALSRATHFPPILLRKG
jgi:hypothetical protein